MSLRRALFSDISSLKTF